MNAFTELHEPDLPYILPRDAYYQLINSLTRAIRPVSDSEEDRTRRDNAAIAQVSSLLPVSAAEANLAAEHAAAHATAMDCLREAQELADADPSKANEQRDRAERQMRTSQNALRLLLRLQNERRRREKDNAGKADLIEYASMSMMANALPGKRKVGPPPQMPEPEPQPAPAAQDDDEPVTEWAREAERYGVMYPRRAVLIRRHGGLPPDCRFGPPDAPLIQALLASKSAAMLALDQEWAGKPVQA